MRGTPLALYACHCTACQRQSGSAFGLSLLVPRAGLTVTPEPATIEHVGGSGVASVRAFCPSCGTRLWHRRGEADRVALKPGTLDDTSWLDPVAHIWTSERQGWVTLPDGVLLYDRNPDMADVIAAFAARHGKSRTT